MYISHLRIENFRNLDTQDILFSEKINLITGANGSGKTSLLEAIYYLGRAKSFRTSKYKHITQYGKDYFRVIAKTQNPAHQIGVERNKDQQLKLRIDRETQRSAAVLAHIVPSIAITSQSFALIDAGPTYRRQFIDYGAFHFSPEFYFSWIKYQKALKSRNAGLKQKIDKAVIASFTPLLAKYGELIHQTRYDYFKQLKPLLSTHLNQLNFPYDIKIKYNAGWNVENPLAVSLDKYLDNDYRVSHTRYGPHRADITFSTSKGNVADYLSRGQQKSLILALQLAQIDLISTCNNHSPILIIDDISSELDAEKRNHTLQYLADLNCQMFFSTTEKDFFYQQIRQYANLIPINSGRIEIP